MSTEQTERLKMMREKFPPNQISTLPRKTRDGGVIHLPFVGHAALTDRLLDVDPCWTWEPLAMSPEGLPVMDNLGGMWIKLTVCGVTRLGYGHAGDKEGGDAIKEIIGDALRNAAMRFGAALELWHKGELHADKEWTRTDVMRVSNAIIEHFTQGRDMGGLQEWEIAVDSDEEFAKAVWSRLPTPERDKIRDLQQKAREK